MLCNYWSHADSNSYRALSMLSANRMDGIMWFDCSHGLTLLVSWRQHKATSHSAANSATTSETSKIDNLLTTNWPAQQKQLTCRVMVYADIRRGTPTFIWQIWSNDKTWPILEVWTDRIITPSACTHHAKVMPMCLNDRRWYDAMRSARCRPLCVPLTRAPFALSCATL